MPQKTLKEKLENIRELAEECLKEIKPVFESEASHTPKPAQSKKEIVTDVNLQIVNKIGDCDEADAIQEKILDKAGVEGRILLPFYVSSKYFKNSWLNSGDVEKITADLGVKINIKNVSNYLITYRKYLESGAVRKKGQPTPYRLNRSGIKRFEQIINAEKP